MKNYPSFGTPEYQEYLKKEQGRHNTYMKVLKKVCEEHQRVFSYQLQINLEKFNNQGIRNTINHLVKQFNTSIENFTKIIDEIVTKFEKWMVRDLRMEGTINQIKNQIECSQLLCKKVFNSANHPIDHELLAEMETIGNNLISYAENKKWE